MDEDKENRGKGIKKLNAEQVSEQILESDKKTQDIKVQHDDIDPNPPRPPGLWPTFPWHFKPKWPLTRKERLAGLEEISPHYEQTLQKDNIRAAKEWHASFPLDQVVPREHWCFQDGKRIKESEIDPKGGNIWDEGLVIDDFLLDTQDSSQNIILPGPAATVTGNTS